MKKWFISFVESILIMLVTLVIGLFLSKEYIYNNESLIKNNDPVMYKFLNRVKVINKFRFIVYWIIGPATLVLILSIIINLIF
ncbi:hypothetical protein [Mammaliicoccus sciuri]|uniref:hypothetical protein n=1 Tax=Mammaliicoccus sciuri TaxID=1296 RepID=UPI002737D039|nr:hypothetical protein [Mammaliicoccus sciuri]